MDQIFSQKKISLGEWFKSLFRKSTEEEKQAGAAQKVINKITGIKQRHIPTLSRAQAEKGFESYLAAVGGDKRLSHLLEKNLVGEDRKSKLSFREKCTIGKLVKFFTKKRPGLSAELASIQFSQVPHRLTQFAFRNQRSFETAVEKIKVLNDPKTLPEGVQKGWSHILRELEEGNQGPFLELLQVSLSDGDLLHNQKLLILKEVLEVDGEEVFNHVDSMDLLAQKLSESGQTAPLPVIFRKGVKYIIHQLHERNFFPLYQLAAFLGLGTVTAFPPLLSKFLKKFAGYKGKVGEDLSASMGDFAKHLHTLQEKTAHLEQAKSHLQKNVEKGLFQALAIGKMNDEQTAQRIEEEKASMATPAASTAPAAAVAAATAEDPEEIEEPAYEEPVEQEEFPDEETFEEEEAEDFEEEEPAEEVAEEKFEVEEEEPEVEEEEEEPLEEGAGGPSLDEVSPYIDRSSRALAALKEGESRIPVVVDGELQITEGDDADAANEGFSYITQVIQAGAAAGAPKEQLVEMISTIATLPQAANLLNDDVKGALTELYKQLSE